jgi:hypothetical protein
MRNPWFSILSGFARPLDGLEAILAQMAAGQMSQDEAARQIRELAASRTYRPGIRDSFEVSGSCSW